MRLLLYLIASLIALTTLLAACGDDEPAMRGDPQMEQQQEQDDAQPPPSASPDDSQQSAQSEQQEAQSADETGEEPSDAAPATPTTPRDPLLAEAEAAYQAWSENLDTMVFDVVMEFDIDGMAMPTTAKAVYQTEPFMMLMSMDMRGMLEDLDYLSEDEAASLAEFLQMQILMTEDDQYLSMPSLGGWVDLSEDLDALLGEFAAAMLGDPAAFADLSGVDQSFYCAEVADGAAPVAYDVYEGKQVWLIDCAIDAAAMGEDVEPMLVELGFDPELAHLVHHQMYESMSGQLRAVISRASGAPLLLELSMALTDVFAAEDEGSGDEGMNLSMRFAQTLRSWNEPVSFPTPEPLIDASVLDSLMLGGDAADWDEQAGDGFRNPPELLTSNELLELARAWALSVDELTLQFDAQAVIDGEARTAATAIHSSKSQGAYETAVVIDGAEAFRLLWNRDGIWTGVEEADGQIVWEPSSPAALGFAAVDVDEFLADPEYIDFTTYAALLDLAWLSRTIEGDGPPVYELGIESGPRRPGEDYFEPLVELLRAATAELLAESVTIEAIDQVSTIITVHGDSGRIVSQVTTAEFDSSAGRVELAVNTAMSTGGMIEFSSPGG